MKGMMNMPDMNRTIELYRLKAQMLDEELSPAQKKHFLDTAAWLESMNFATAEESMEAIKSTPYYLGGAEAIELDGINMRIRAMEEIGYDDVAAIHRERLAKFKEKGWQEYCFSQEWIDDYNRAAEAERVYAQRKEAFGKVFSAYISVITAGTDDDMKKAEKNISHGLSELEDLGTSFEELISLGAFRRLTMLTEKGLDNFREFIVDFRKGVLPAHDDVTEAAAKTGKWVRSHRGELVEAGRKEIWHSAACIAVPSDDAYGYDYISLREVNE